MWNCDIFSPVHSLTSLKIVAELRCHQGTFGATYLWSHFWSAQPYFINTLLSSCFKDRHQKFNCCIKACPHIFVSGPQVIDCLVVLLAIVDIGLSWWVRTVLHFAVFVAHFGVIQPVMVIFEVLVRVFG